MYSQTVRIFTQNNTDSFYAPFCVLVLEIEVFDIYICDTKHDH